MQEKKSFMIDVDQTKVTLPPHNQGPHTSSGLGGRANHATPTSFTGGFGKFDHVILPTWASQMSKLFTSLFGNQSEERNQNQNRGKTFEFSQPVLIKLSRLITPLSSNQSKARNQNQNRDLESKAARPVWSVSQGLDQIDSLLLVSDILSENPNTAMIYFAPLANQKTPSSSFIAG